MSDQLYRLDSDWMKRTAWAADTLAGLHDLGVLVKVEFDYEAAADVLEGRMIGLRSRTGAMKAAQRSVNAALGIEGGDDG